MKVSLSKIYFSVKATHLLLLLDVHDVARGDDLLVRPHGARHAGDVGAGSLRSLPSLLRLPLLLSLLGLLVFLLVSFWFDKCCRINLTGFWF